MKKFLAIASILFAAAPAMAQPILLAEFERREGLSERTSLRWDISAPPFTWELLTRQSDEGAVFQAPPEFVAAANQTDNFEIVFHCFDCNGTVDRAGGDSITVDQIFAGHNSGGRVFARAFVPQLGPNFSGYEITSATQTITRWRPFVGRGGEFWTKVQLFGERVPEPTTGILASMAGVTCLFQRRRNSNCTC